MIIVLSGTLEGREITSLLAARGCEAFSLTAENHCSRVVVRNSLLEILEAYPAEGGIEHVFTNFSDRVVTVIDATHPFPGGISEPAKEFCCKRNIPYIRFIREEMNLPQNPLIVPVYFWEEAAAKASDFGNTVFLTTGSHNLAVFLKHPAIAGKRIVVRVLPDHRVIEKVRLLGVTPKDIVAMQGPFSKEMNRVTFKMYNASVVVTKDSGRAGGTDTKIAAALGLKIPVVIIKRSRLLEKDRDRVHTYEQVLEKVAFLLRTP